MRKDLRVIKLQPANLPETDKYDFFLIKRDKKAGSQAYSVDNSFMMTDSNDLISQ